MRVCHCIMPSINPLACKNCNNNTDEYNENEIYTFDPYKMDCITPSDEEIKKLFMQVYPKSIPADEIKENG